MKDPYQVLGVAKDASQDDIHKAYRRLAKKVHPDLHPGDKGAEDRFKEISAAHEILGDAKKRKAFDAGEIDATGAERAAAGGGGRTWYRTYAGGPGGGKYTSAGGFGGFDDLGDVFSDLFGQGGPAGGAGRGGARGFRNAGDDVRYRLAVDFLDAVHGARKRVSMPDGRGLDINVPAGVRDGQTLRLKGQGRPGFGGGPNGDAYVEIEVRPHAQFRREGDDILAELPVSIPEAVLGGKVPVPTVDGTVNVTVPKGANTGTRLRIKGKGVADPKTGRRGDQYVTLKIMLPDGGDGELERFAKEWGERRPYDPRRNTEAKR